MEDYESELDDTRVWHGWIDDEDDGVFYCRLAPDGEDFADTFMEIERENFLTMMSEDDRARFLKDDDLKKRLQPNFSFAVLFTIAVVLNEDETDGEVVVTLPPPWTEEEIIEARKKGEELASALKWFSEKGDSDVDA